VQTLATSDFSQQLKAAGELMQRKERPKVGEWLWTMRQGAERDLVEELLLGKDLRPRGFMPALVVSARAPRSESERLEVTFARQCFEVAALESADDLAMLADKLLPRAVQAVGQGAEYALHVFVPDSDDGNRLAARAQALDDLLAERLGRATESKRIEELGPRHASVPLVQVCLLAPDTAALGVIASDRALSPYPGGRARMRLSADFISRAARKLEEAFAWIGVSPGSSELCVDLGAAPGGWSSVLLARKARVIAVDPARMDAKLASDRRLRHVQGDAFKFMPDETVDWLLCDMVWRPIEVAQMLGRWARKRQTRMLVANFKLPMKRKVEQVDTLRRTLQAAGFTGIRTRQLYHDRDEITVFARVR
jgi:23S rRNA (cytidine2498-2'-O)-methyltransferase